MIKSALFVALLIIVHSCSSQDSDATDGNTAETTIARKDEGITPAEVQLIEVILNMPDLIRFSRLDAIGNQHGSIKVFVPKYAQQDTIIRVQQNGQDLELYSETDSLDLASKPWYVFEELEIHGDSAYVRVSLDISGAIAFGSLHRANGRWIADSDFRVGVR